MSKKITNADRHRRAKTNAVAGSSIGVVGAAGALSMQAVAEIAQHITDGAGMLQWVSGYSPYATGFFIFLTITGMALGLWARIEMLRAARAQTDLNTATDNGGTDVGTDADR